MGGRRSDSWCSLEVMEGDAWVPYIKSNVSMVWGLVLLVCGVGLVRLLINPVG